MHERLESDSNVIVERELHPKKLRSQIFLTEEGIQIDESDEHLKNAKRSMYESLESDSNVIVERDLQQLKQPWQIFLTEEGIQIDESDEQSVNA
jgi:competence CoiA-like predicted nuclease